MITEEQYEYMLDSLIDQLRALNGIVYTTPQPTDRDFWKPFARSMLNSILIVGGIIVLGDAP